MLTPEQRQEFDERGFVRIPKAFSSENAAAMEDRMWRILEKKYDLSRTDPTTWDLTYTSGLQGFKTDAVFNPIGGKTTLGVIDDLLGADCWKKPKNWGQFLVSFPEASKNESDWTVPARVWHTDFSFAGPPDRLFGLLMFSFMSDVPPRTGATLVVAGSPRLIARHVTTQKREDLAKMKLARRAFLRSDPWLQALTSDPDAPDRIQRFMETEHRIDDIPVQVAELTGEAGEIIVGHPWLLHAAGTANCGQAPRLMRVQRLHKVR